MYPQVKETTVEMVYKMDNPVAREAEVAHLRLDLVVLTPLTVMEGTEQLLLFLVLLLHTLVVVAVVGLHHIIRP